MFQRIQGNIHDTLNKTVNVHFDFDICIYVHRKKEREKKSTKLVTQVLHFNGMIGSYFLLKFYSFIFLQKVYVTHL